jgi:malonyl-CoA/methylmalonyl-CoA synthetase
VQVEKSVEALMLYLAVLRAGHVYLPLNNAYQAGRDRVLHRQRRAGGGGVRGRNFGWVSQLILQGRHVKHVFTLNDDRTRHAARPRAQFHADQHEPVRRGSDDLAAILYTSGTTGRSKGAMLTHGNLLSNAQVLKDYWGWKPGDVLIHALPIFHVHGLFVASHGALLNGSRMIWFGRSTPRP